MGGFTYHITCIYSRLYAKMPAQFLLFVHENRPDAKRDSRSEMTGPSNRAQILQKDLIRNSYFSSIQSNANSSSHDWVTFSENLFLWMYQFIVNIHGVFL
jgi:hypothetical protein